MTTTNAQDASGTDASPASSDAARSCADISVEDDRWQSISGLVELIPDLVAASLDEIGQNPETRTVSVALLSDSAVRTLNKLFRRKDEPTNVLSFPSGPPVAASTGGAPAFLGDVALAYETVVAEAAAERKPAVHHAAHLVVHGVLHLSGFDHGNEAEAERMEGAERLVLARFGIPDPYRDGETLLEPSA